MNNVEAGLQLNIKRIFPVLIVAVVIVLLTLGVARCKRDVVFLKTKYDQELSVSALLDTSAYIRGYGLRDKDGRRFGIYLKIKPNPFYAVASLFSGKSIFPAGDFDWAIVFPECAREDPGFSKMLEDLNNPKSLFDDIAPGYVLSPQDDYWFRQAKDYFSGSLDQTITVKIVFKKGCPDVFLISDEEVVADVVYVDVPVSSSIYREGLKEN